MEDDLAYQEETWEELINGKVIAMSSRSMFDHNRVAFNIAYIFETCLGHKQCTVIPFGTDLHLTEKDRFVPDMMVVCDQKKIQNDGVHGVPDLVVEVLSPSTIKLDRMYKKVTYEKCGVQEYWLVSPAGKYVEVYRLEKGAFALYDVYSVYPEALLKK